MKFTFVVSTQAHSGKTVGPIKEVNSHIATYRHSQKRLGKELRPAKIRKNRNDYDLKRLKLLLGGPTRTKKDGQAKHAQRVEIDEKQAESLALTISSFLPAFDRKVTSPIDPFLRLPVDITAREKSLMQFFLSEGRSLTYGTSRQSSKCLALQWARAFMEHSQIFTYLHLCIVEHILCGMSGTPVSGQFYYRRAQAYRATNEVLSDPSATFYQKVYHIHMLVSLEAYLGNMKLLEQHASAMDAFVESSGGVRRIVKEKRQANDRIDSYHIVCFAKGIELPLMPRKSLDEALGRFIQLLRRIVDWVKRIRTDSGSEISGTMMRSMLSSNDTTRQALHDYLNWLLDTNLTQPGVPFKMWAGSFRYLFSLCLTQTLFGYNAAQSAKYLDEVDYCASQGLAYDYTTGTLGRNVHPCTAVHWTMGEAEWSEEQEIAYSQATVDVITLAPLFSSDLMLEVCQGLMACALVGSMDTAPACFDDDHLREIQDKLTTGWMLKYLESNPRDWSDCDTQAEDETVRSRSWSVESESEIDVKAENYIPWIQL